MNEARRNCERWGKGGLKSGESRRKKRELQKEFKFWMRVFDELQSKDEAQANRVLDALMLEWYRRNVNKC